MAYQIKKQKEEKEIKTSEYKIDKQTLLGELAQFTGTEQYHSSTFGKLNLTDGVHHLRERANSYWLIDIVESVQDLPKIKQNSEFIVWKIEVDKDKKFKVTAWNDTPYKSKPLYEQKGDYTDFPLDDYEFYQEGDVLLLKSEH
jgi:hypothetical protein